MPLTARQVFRDFVTDGIPSSGKNRPDKAEVRSLLTSYEVFISGAGAIQSLVKTTKALLLADIAHDGDTMAWVVADPVAENNGIYQKFGASGLGTWNRVADLPYPFIPASNVGSGTANAIKATTDISISETALVWLPIFVTNTGSPVTVSFNDGTPVTIKSNVGNDVAIGGLAANSIVLGRQQGTEFRLMTDQVSSAIVAAAEAAAIAALGYRDQAAAYATLALNNQFLNTFAGNGIQTAFTLSFDPGSKNNTIVNVDGVLQLKSAYSLSGTTLTFSEAPPGDGLTNNIEISFGGRININVPGSETVDADKVKATDVTAIRTKLSVYSKTEVDSAVAVSAGFAGHLFGLSGSQNGTDANNDMDFAVGEAASDGAAPVIMALAAAITKRSDAVWAVGNNNGAMDTGTKPTNGWLHWYLIKRPDTGVVDVCCSVSASAPSVGTNIPAAYTKYRRIRSTRTDGSGNIVPDLQFGDEIIWKQIVRENGGAISTGTSAALFALAGAPAGIAVTAILHGSYTSVTDTAAVLITCPSTDDLVPDLNNGGSTIGHMQTGSHFAAGALRVRTNTSRQIRHRAGAAGSLYLFTDGYVDTRGRI